MEGTRPRFELAEYPKVKQFDLTVFGFEKSQSISMCVVCCAVHPSTFCTCLPRPLIETFAFLLLPSHFPCLFLVLLPLPPFPCTSSLLYIPYPLFPFLCPSRWPDAAEPSHSRDRTRGWRVFRASRDTGIIGFLAFSGIRITTFGNVTNVGLRFKLWTLRFAETGFTIKASYSIWFRLLRDF